MKKIIFFMLWGMLTGCKMLYVSTDCNESADFSKYSSYYISYKNQGTNKVARVDSFPIDQDLLKQTMITELNKIYLLNEASPELEVSYNVDQDKNYRPVINYNKSQTTFGRLNVFIKDLKNGNEIWSGSISGIPPSDQGQTVKVLLRKIVSHLFTSFPYNKSPQLSI